MIYIREIDSDGKDVTRTIGNALAEFLPRIHRDSIRNISKICTAEMAEIMWVKNSGKREFILSVEERIELINERLNNLADAITFLNLWYDAINNFEWSLLYNNLAFLDKFYVGDMWMVRLQILSEPKHYECLHMIYEKIEGNKE